jgi:hypothetical protein
MYTHPTVGILGCSAAVLQQGCHPNRPLKFLPAQPVQRVGK